MRLLKNGFGVPSPSRREHPRTSPTWRCGISAALEYSLPAAALRTITSEPTAKAATAKTSSSNATKILLNTLLLRCEGTTVTALLGFCMFTRLSAMFPVHYCVHKVYIDCMNIGFQRIARVPGIAAGLALLTTLIFPLASEAQQPSSENTARKIGTVKTIHDKTITL